MIRLMIYLDNREFAEVEAASLEPGTMVDVQYTSDCEQWRIESVISWDGIPTAVTFTKESHGFNASVEGIVLRRHAESW